MTSDQRDEWVEIPLDDPLTYLKIRMDDRHDAIVIATYRQHDAPEGEECSATWVEVEVPILHVVKLVQELKRLCLAPSDTGGAP